MTILPASFFVFSHQHYYATETFKANLTVHGPPLNLTWCLAVAHYYVKGLTSWEYWGVRRGIVTSICSRPPPLHRYFSAHNSTQIEHI